MAAEMIRPEIMHKDLGILLTNQDKLIVKARAFRFNFGRTRLIFNFGWCNLSKQYRITKSGLLPHIIEDLPEKGYVEFNRLVFCFGYYQLIITKLKKWSLV